MNHIYLNLKRFDIPKEKHGVNSLTDILHWAELIVTSIQDEILKYPDTRFDIFFPEAHLISALEALKSDSPLRIGAQGVHWQDVSEHGNFGAFTTLRTASSVSAIGCKSVLIGHCEERAAKEEIFKRAGITQSRLVNQLLNEEIKAAVNAGLDVLYCIGEKSDEVDDWQNVLGEQLEIGLKDIDLKRISIAYEPIWSIGPGKTPADETAITKVARFIKSKIVADVVYGGGLKQTNAEMLAHIKEISGGLIALTRFSNDIGFYPDEYLEIIKIYNESRANL